MAVWEKTRFSGRKAGPERAAEIETKSTNTYQQLVLDHGNDNFTIIIINDAHLHTYYYLDIIIHECQLKQIFNFRTLQKLFV